MVVSRNRFVAPFAGLLVLAATMCGCIDTSAWTRHKTTPPRETNASAPANQNESKMVEEMVRNRAMYARLLSALSSYYAEQGYPEKATWAQIELNGLRNVKIYSYISDAALSRSDAKAAASLENPGGVPTPEIPIAGQNEVDLVEELVFHRKMYNDLLATMASYYAEQGFAQKAALAQTELNGLRRVKTYKYIMDAEVPRADLRPTTSIAEADKLYADGRKLMRKGGRGFPDFYNQDTMRLALAKFKELVDKYPNSDKIDDAAYYIGEIHKEYEKEKDNALAIEWYKRAIQWDPNTPHPCRFRIATTYDYRLHERELALYWYQKTLEEEAKFNDQGGDFTANIRFSKKRIAQLTPEEHLHSPGEPTVDGRPATADLPAPAATPSAPEPGPTPESNQ